MKKIITSLAVIAITVFCTSCQKEAKKELLSQNENEDATTEGNVLNRKNFVVLSKCRNIVSATIHAPLEAYLNQTLDTSLYPIEFSVTAGNQPICIPKRVKFIAGTNNFAEIPATDTAGFTLEYGITDDLVRYVDGFTSFGFLTPEARSAKIERLDAGSQLTFTGYMIKPNKTATFRFTGRISEVPNDPEAVYGHYRFALLRLPVMLKPGAASSQWTVFDFSTMNYNLSAPTPERGHQ